MAWWSARKSLNTATPSGSCAISLSDICRPLCPFSPFLLNMIELFEVTKKYGNKTAVDRLSLRIEPGELFAFLGPNGAGKTATIKLLCGLLFPTAGSAPRGGFDLQAQSAPRRPRI